MDQCSVVKERLPELMTETLGADQRESAHRHIEQCSQCAQEWMSTRQVWAQLGDVSDRPVPQGLRESFLMEARNLMPTKRATVVAFPRRPTSRWLAQAAVAVMVVGGAFYAGRNTSPLQINPTEAALQSVQPAAFHLTDNAVIPASQVNPDIQGTPQIANVRFQPAGSTGSDVSVSFDITSHVTITGNPEDKSLVNLLSYVLQNRDYPTHSRSSAIQWVSDTYGGQGTTDPEIVKALANVLKNDTHEGVRIKAVEALKSLPPSLAPEARTALVYALKNDPNPAVRMKAVEALSNLAAADANSLDINAVDALREKAGQEDENPYVRVKAAEALSQIRL